MNFGLKKATTTPHTSMTRVTDTNGTPLQDVLIVTQGGMLGTGSSAVTDNYGNYDIELTGSQKGLIFQKENYNEVSYYNQPIPPIVVMTLKSGIGKVTDTNGTPLQDVLIVTQGGMLGTGSNTVTDNQGLYSIELTGSQKGLIFQKENYNGVSYYNQPIPPIVLMTLKSEFTPPELIISTTPEHVFRFGEDITTQYYQWVEISQLDNTKDWSSEFLNFLSENEFPTGQAFIDGFNEALNQAINNKPNNSNNSKPNNSNNTISSSSVSGNIASKTNNSKNNNTVIAVVGISILLLVLKFSTKKDN